MISESDLYLMRLSARLLAMEDLLRAIVFQVCRTSPEAISVLKGAVSLCRQRAEVLTMPGFSAEHSDLVSSTYQESLETLLKYFEDVIKPKA